jgi:hypothetical protein
MKDVIIFIAGFFIGYVTKYFTWRKIPVWTGEQLKSADFQRRIHDLREELEIKYPTIK